MPQPSFKSLNVSLLLLALLTDPERRACAAEPVETLLRRRAEAFVAAVNTNDPATLTAFALEHLATRIGREGLAPRFAERMRAEFAELGPVERHSAQVLKDGTLLFVFCKRAKSGSWENYQFRVQLEDGHRLQLVFRATAVEPMERPLAALGSDEAQGWLRRFEAALEEQQPFSGVLVARKGGREVVAVARGTADASVNAPVTRGTRFGMASGSKMFTAVAILQLAQQGRLSLNDHLVRHLPQFPNREFASRATIHGLLTHTAGAGNYWDEEYEKQWSSITELPQMLPHVLRNLGASTTGGFSYSNSGYVLLGLVIEAVAGTSYYDYVKKHVFTPAGMVETGFPVGGEAAGAARPYEPEMDAGAVRRGVFRPVTLGARGSSAGGAVTTVDDLLRFADALEKGVLLDAAHRELLTREHVPYAAAKDLSYGYGTIVDASRGVRSWGHGGMAPGTQFDFRVYPERGAIVVVMSNYNTIAGPELASALDHLARNPDR